MKRALYWLMLASLLPGLLAQGLWLRRRAPRFAPAAGAAEGYCCPNPVFRGVNEESNGNCAVGQCAAGQRNPEPLRLLGLGDSIIAGVGVETMVHSLTACLARELAGLSQRPVQWWAVGRSGAASGDIVHDLLPQLPPRACDVIVLSLGVNDVTGLTPSRRWRRRLGELFAALARHSPQAEILLLGLPPLASFPLLPQPLRAVMALRGNVLDSQARHLIDAWPQVVHIPHKARLPREDFAADGYHPSAATYARWASVLAELTHARLTRAGLNNAGP